MKLNHLLAAVAIFCLGAGTGHAQQTDFSRKTITIYIGNSAGGTYDLMGRLVSRHLGHFLPGNPTVVPENMPGAGTLRAANYIYNVAPKDGTALGIVTDTIAVEQALRNPAAQFDARKLVWIGRVAASNAVHAIWHTAKVQSIEDAKHFEATVAGTGAGNVAETVSTLLNAVIGTKFKIIKGYPSANEALLAVERGEVEVAVPNWTTLKTARADWLREGKIKVILQDLNERGPELPDAPALGELGDTPEARQLLGLYGGTSAIGRAFFGPPGLSPAATKTLRDGFVAMCKDPAFLADAKQIDADLNVGSGEEVQKAVERTLNVPEGVLQRAREIFAR
ncbi:MAG TPA: tripartite tricarboxylate transporter substrate-binding protein [Xanthobacteraceae bacterium]|nr:tripartite tricarboxylate transporter substrate-binding protein [Xanthobacteraceae bacterium]